MERKELLKIIYDLKTTDYDKLFKICGAFTHTAQKQIRRMVFGFAKDGRLELLSETGTIRVPPHLLEKKKKFGNNKSEGFKPESSKLEAGKTETEKSKKKKNTR
jgi:hypothetical protein